MNGVFTIFIIWFEPSPLIPVSPLATRLESNETKTTTSATANTKSSQQDDGSGDDSDIQIVGDPDEVELTPPPKTHDGDDTGCDYYADFFKK